MQFEPALINGRRRIADETIVSSDQDYDSFTDRLKLEELAGN